MTEIKLQTPKLDPVTGKFMVAKGKTVIDYDAELEIFVKVQWHENDNGSPGLKMSEVIQNMDAPDHKKQVLRNQFKDMEFSYSTRNRFVDPATGLTVEPDPQTGLYPETGEIPERTYFQNLPIGLSGGTKVWDDVLAIMLNNMQLLFDKNLGA